MNYCLNCQCRYYPQRRESKFCSRACMTVYRQRNRKMIICPGCKQAHPQHAKNNRQQYCSRQCFKDHLGPKLARCHQCGHSFLQKHSDKLRGRRFCNFTCYSKSRRTGNYKNCEVCGKLFYRSKFHLKHARFCSWACLRPAVRRAYVANPRNRKKVLASMHYALEKRWQDPAQHKNVSQQSLKRWSAPHYKKKMGHAISKGLQPLWSDPIYREKRIKAFMKAQERRPTNPEKKLGQFLRRLYPGEFKYNGNRAGVVLSSHIPDFINVNGRKQVIEMFGCYWHGCKFCGHKNSMQRRNDAKRIKDFNNLGWDSLVVWQHELSDLDKLQIRLRNFMQC